MKHSFKNCAIKTAHISLSLVLVLFLCITSFAQTSMKELSEMVNDEKGYQKMMKSGMVQHIMNALKVPSAYRKFMKKGYRAEKIGILTLNLQYGTEDASIGEDMAQNVIDAIAPQVIASFKAEGTNQDVAILTPEEYLTSQEAKDLYNSIEGTTDYVVAARGFKPITNCGVMNTTFSCGFDKETLTKKVGQLLWASDLDAFIILSVNASFGKLQKNGAKDVKNDIQKALRFYSVSSNTILKNQNPFDPNTKYPKLGGGYAYSGIGAWSILVRGGLTIQEYSRGKVDNKATDSKNLVRKLNLVNDYTPDLAQTFANFATHVIWVNKEAVRQSNEKNKVE